jgi:hypothetical protein
MPWAIEITAYVNAHCGLDVSLWTATFGRPIGNVGWSTVVESQAQLSAETEKLLTDGGYLDLLEAGAEFIATPGEDTLRELVYGTPGEPSGVGALAVVTTGVANIAKMAAAIGWGVEVSQHVEKVIDTPVFFFSDVYGALGAVTWITIVADAAAADAARAKIAADPGYLELISKAEDLYLLGEAASIQTMRIA